MQSKNLKSVEPKQAIKSSAKEILTPSFAKLIKEESPKNSSNFKEIKRLKLENTRLSFELSKCQEELRRKDEFALVLNSFSEEKYDFRRLYMYKAKVAKQERLVIIK